MANKKNVLINKETIESLKELGSDNDKSFFIEILSLFLQESEKLMQKIKEQYLDKNYEALRISAHTLKGASANIGAVALSDISSKIELQARENAGENLGELYSELKDCYILTKKEIVNLIS